MTSEVLEYKIKDWNWMQLQFQRRKGMERKNNNLSKVDKIQWKINIELDIKTII